MTTLTVTIIEAMAHPGVWARWFRDPTTWAAWRVFLAAVFDLPMSADELAIYRACTGRAAPPAGGATEAWLICGRRAGKSMTLALIAVYLAYFIDWSPYLSPGERGTVMVVAVDRRAARSIFRYARALVAEVPTLAPLIERETNDTLDLKNGVTIEILTASFRTLRSYSVVAALLDELAFWRSEDSANPDEEILATIRPSMATIPGARLLCASSPYARRGALWNAYRRHYGQDAAPVLVWRADTKTMNPSVPDSVIEEAYERDPASAAAEYGASFRSDIEVFLSRELVDTAVDPGIILRPPIEGVRYLGGCDPAGGAAGGDSFTCAVGHAEGGMVVLDCVFERRGPFNPAEVCAEIAGLLKGYRVTEIVGDHYSAQWVVSAMAEVGITYRHSPRDRSAIYLDALPLFSSGRVRLIDNQRMVNQWVSLERRTSTAGKDRVDHPAGAGARDDLCNAAALVLTMAAGGSLPASGAGIYGLYRDMAAALEGKATDVALVDHQREPSTANPHQRGSLEFVRWVNGETT